MAKHSTPFYLYDGRLLKATLAEIARCTSPRPAMQVHYAIKANSNPAVLKLIAAAGLGADCVSGGEIDAAVAAGFNPSAIVFAGVGKSDAEICRALEVGIFCFNVESEAELKVINELAGRMNKTARIALRLNPDVDAHTHKNITTGREDNKFGIPLHDAERIIKHIRTMKHVEYVGLHFHIGSQILDLTPYEELCNIINHLQDRLDAAGIVTPNINVGGGLGVDYIEPEQHPIPDFEHYFTLFAQRLALRPGQRLHFELGRSVVAQCGRLISRVLYVKPTATKQFLIVDAGFTDLIRPALYQAYHKIVNLSALPDAPCATYDVVGPICESSDVFVKDYEMPLSHRGDLIAICSAGAYGEVMASTYNCRPLVKGYLDDNL